tara:strand:+ start:218 stop:358 length:141 start_codon:yes stop_codon:yes gene_type:complete
MHSESSEIGIIEARADAHDVYHLSKQLVGLILLGYDEDIGESAILC